MELLNSFLGISVITLVSFLAGLLTLLEYFRYIPSTAVLLRNPGRLLGVPRTALETYRFKRFWAPVVSDEPVTIVFPASDEDDSREGTQQFDHKGLHSLVDELNSRFRNPQFEFVSDKEVSDADKNRNIICASGPIPNQVTYELLYETGLPYRFDRLTTGKIINSIVSKDGSVHLEPDTYYDESTAEKKIRRDYGIITRVPNPYNTDKVIVNVAGGFGEGTLAGFQLLTMPAFLSELRDIEGEYFQALYSVSVDRDGTIKTPSLLTENARSVDPDVLERNGIATVSRAEVK